jgi:hypothetical protein
MYQGWETVEVPTGRSEGKRPLQRTRHRWEDKIKIYLQEVEWGCMDWIALTQYRDSWEALVNAVMNLRVPYNEGNSLSS